MEMTIKSKHLFAQKRFVICFSIFPALWVIEWVSSTVSLVLSKISVCSSMRTIVDIPNSELSSTSRFESFSSKFVSSSDVMPSRARCRCSVAFAFELNAVADPLLPNNERFSSSDIFCEYLRRRLFKSFFNFETVLLRDLRSSLSISLNSSSIRRSTRSASAKDSFASWKKRSPNFVDATPVLRWKVSTSESNLSIL